MGPYKIEETRKPEKQIKLLKSKYIAFKKRFIAIMQLIEQNPYSNFYGGEDLRCYNSEGNRSFELSKKDRIVIEIDAENKVVYIISYLGHYSDK